MERKAVVAGATGLVGQELVKQLLVASFYSSVTVIVRRETGIRHAKLHEMVIDFDLLAQTEVDMSGADVFCTLGTTIKKAGSQEAFRKVDYTYPLVLAQLAKQQGARQFLVITSIGANSSSRIFYSRVKGEVEDALHELELPALHIFRPSLLLGQRDEFRLGERLASIVMPVFGGLLGKYRPVQASAVAKAMVSAAKQGQSGAHTYESNFQ